MRHFITILSLIALSAAALFYEQVLAIFAGMSVMESLAMIVKFILHVAVATIAGSLVMALPKFINPWFRTLRRRQRDSRRARNVVSPTAAPKPRRLTVNELLTMLAPNGKVKNTSPEPADHVELKF